MSRARAGKTLIEVAVIIAMTGVAMMLATTALVTLFRIERQARAATGHDISVSRLARIWRADVHAAVTANLNSGCQLTLADGRSVRYAFTAPAISREVRRAESIEHRDAFILSRDAQASFSRSADTGVLLQIAINSSATAEQLRTTSVPPLTISAALNLHQQAAKLEGQP